jgi:catechol 2,3-dioxygenase-like lactoylglutathione lyase family enzyme
MPLSARNHLKGEITDVLLGTVTPLITEGPKMVFLNTPGTHDVITLHESEPIGNLGVAHFGFSLQDKKDLDEALKEVERAGGKLIRRGEHAPGYPFAYVSDPDGYVLEL